MNYGTDSGGECGIPYSSRFKMPSPPAEFTPPKEGNANISLNNLWYSFDQGPVHYLVMSTEHDWQEGSVQYRFLEQDLKNVDRSVTPWIVFSGHRPLYTSESGYAGFVPAQKLRASIEPLLQKYNA